MKILYAFESDMSHEEKEQFLSKISIVDPVNFYEECCFFIKKNTVNSNKNTGPMIEFAGNKDFQKNFQRIFLNKYVLLSPELLLSSDLKYKNISPYTSSVIPDLIKNLVNEFNKLQSA